MKTLIYNNRSLEIQAPSNLEFDNDFFELLYTETYDRISDNSQYTPIWNVDDIHNDPIRAVILAHASASQEKVKSPSKKATNKDRAATQLHIRHFLKKYPEMSGLFLNTVSLAKQIIANAEFLLGQECTSENFIEIKQVIDDQNSKAWSRERDKTESQSGVSTLGTISEALLKLAFKDLANDQSFFQVKKSEVQTYGDFVLTCLPNNLWISVKSNFARERLLASGFTTDIIGVGFFQDPGEFTGQIRVRNFQRAGFLAMYCPDVAVTEEQIRDGTSTYDLIEQHHANKGTNIPKNINGQPFIRRLSALKADLGKLLEEKDIRKRVTVHF